MSEEKSEVKKNRKINRMTPEQAKATLAKCEASGDTQSLYYRRVKKIVEK